MSGVSHTTSSRRDDDLAAPEIITRIDAPHALAASPPPSDSEFEAGVLTRPAELVAAAAGVSAAHLPEQFETQSRQLAEHLSARAREVDRRESQLNAHLAKLDSEARTARLVVHDQVQRLGEQEQQYYARLAELASREAALAATAEGDETAQSAQLADRQRELCEWQIRLEAEEHRQRLAWQKTQSLREGAMQLARRLMHSLERRRQALDEREEQQGTTIDAFAARQQELVAQLEERRSAQVAAEQQFEVQRATLDAREQQLTDERNLHQEQVRQQQALLVQQQCKADEAWLERDQALHARSEELAQRQSMLDQMQAEVAATHREALELRLATEQLWSQMGGQIKPAQLAQSLKQLRAKLADHFALAEQSVSRQKADVRELIVRLDWQLQKLDEQRHDLHAWANRRQEQIEQQAARLVAREQELDEQQAVMQRERERWQLQRYELEDEIHRLKAELRRPVAA